MKPTWMNCKNKQTNKTIMLGKRNQTQKSTCCYEPIVMKSKTRQNKFTVVEVKIVCQNNSFCLERNMRELSGVMEMFCIFIWVMVHVKKSSNLYILRFLHCIVYENIPQLHTKIHYIYIRSLIKFNKLTILMLGRGRKSSFFLSFSSFF